jgi:hypothetical protein
MNPISKLTPETQTAIKQIAEIVKPVIDDIHDKQPTGKNYYNDYMKVISFSAGNDKGKIKLVAISLLYLGCNPIGIQDAVNNLI